MKLVPNRVFRTVHLIDIENLVGSATLSPADVRAVLSAYTEADLLHPCDHVIVACSHRNALAVSEGWPGARYLWRSGPDGADLALLGVANEERLAERFGTVVIGSGDGIFALSAAALAADGVTVDCVGRRGGTSARLRLAAQSTTYICTPVSHVMEAS